MAEFIDSEVLQNYFLYVKLTYSIFVKEIFMIFQKLFGKKVEKPTYLIVGLGNPGREYHLNRHNIGFLAVDRVGSKMEIPLGHLRSKALIGEKIFTDKKIFLAKPQTFMNQSGLSVASLLRFYRVPLEQLLVIYDDLDLPLGTIRLRENGSSAGHKGMNSIIEQLGSSDFPRLRLGIGRPNGRMDVMDYVLQDFNDNETEILSLTLDCAFAATELFLNYGIDAAMTKFNGPVV